MKKLILIILIVLPNFLVAQLVNDFRVNDDTSNYFQGNARLGADKFGNFVIVWHDERRSGHGNIYCQRFDNLANRIGNNFRINSVIDTASIPMIAVRKDGSLGVCWYETNSTIPNRERIKFKLFDKFGLPISNEIILKDTIPMTSMKFSVDTDTSGKFVSVINYNGDIFFQRIDKYGNKIGNHVKVNDDTGAYGQGYPEITVIQDGSFIICWQDARPPVPHPHADDIFMQMFDSSGNKIGVNIWVNDVIYIEDEEFEPYISSDTSGAFCIGFSRWNFIPGNCNAVLQLFDKNGNKIGNNVNVVNNVDAIVKVLSKRDNGEMIIGYRYNSGIITRGYGQRRKANAIRIGNIL